MRLGICISLADHHQFGTQLRSLVSRRRLDYNEFYTMAVIDAALAAEQGWFARQSLLEVGICYIGGLPGFVLLVSPAELLVYQRECLTF